jgi:hypothetical protein
VTDAATGEEHEVVVGFRPASVFDASQLANLDEKPLPELVPSLPDDVGPLYARVKGRIEASGIRVVETALPNGIYGASSGGEIRVRGGLDSRSRLFVLVHELTHELAHQGEGQQAKTVEQREFEAEATTYVVAAALGLEQPHSADYLLSYRATAETLRASLGTIQGLVRKVLAVVDAPRGDRLAHAA